MEPICLSLGAKGEAPGWFKFPTDIIANKRGQLIVADLFNHRLQVIEVKYQKEFPSLKELKQKKSPPAATEKTGSAAPDAGDSGAPAAKAAVSPEGVDQADSAPPQLPESPGDGTRQETVPALPEPPSAEIDEKAAAPAGLDAHPASGSQENSPDELAPGPPDAEIKEQIIPEQQLPAYPDEPAK